jgi:WD40 repeat protein
MKFIHWLAFSLLFHINVVSSHTPEPLTPPLHQLENATASAVAWSPDGTQLAVGDSSGVHLYTETLEWIRSMPQPSEQMKTLAWSPRGTYLAAGGGNDIGQFDPSEPRDTSIHIWNVFTRERITTYSQHSHFVPNIAWNDYGTLIASSSWDRTIRVWNPITGETYFVIVSPSIPNYANEILSMDWGGNGHFAAIVGSAALFVWTSFQEKPQQIDISGLVAVWSHNGDYIALGSALYDVSEQRYIQLDGCNQTGFVSWNPSDTLFAIYTWDAGVIVCDPFEDRVVIRFEAGIAPINPGVIFGYQYSLDWHPDGTRLAGAAGDGYIRIWDVSGL